MLKIRSRPGRPPKRHPLERENHSPSHNNSSSNKLELSLNVKNKSSDSTSQRLETTKKYFHQNTKLNGNDAINVAIENSAITSSSTSPFSILTNSSSSPSSDEHYSSQQQKNLISNQNQGNEQEKQYFSTNSNAQERFYAKQTLNFHPDQKISKFFNN